MKIGSDLTSAAAGPRAGTAVAAAGRTRRRHGRDGSAQVFRPSRGPAGGAAGDSFDLASLQSGSVSATLAGIVAQNVFHARFGSRPEESIVHAARAYLRTSDLAFRDAPTIRRVA
jgi:hypothetical protein